MYRMVLITFSLLLYSSLVLAESKFVLKSYLGTLPMYQITNKAAKVNLILVVGGKGITTTKIIKINNLLIRSLNLFSAAGFNVFVFPNPSKNSKASYDYRVSADHIDRIALLVEDIIKSSPLPIWLVGHSRGTVSLAYFALKHGAKVDGIAHLSSVFESKAPSGKRNRKITTQLTTW